MKASLIALILTLTIGLASGTSNDKCSVLSNKTCEVCTKESGCAFCKNNKLCFVHEFYSLETPCAKSDVQYKTCIANLQTWLIVIGCVAGVILIAVIVLICCCRRKCVQCQRRRDDKKEDAHARRMDERRTAAEARSADRNQAAEQLRMKYGLLKAKDDSGSYNRLS